MSDAKTNYLENRFINHTFGGTTFTKPTQWWLEIYNASPTEEPNGTTPTPLTARIQIDAWTLLGNEAKNTNLIQFPAVPAATTWTVSHYVIWDAQTSGNPLYQGAFRVTKLLEEGDILLIAPGQLKIREY